MTGARAALLSLLGVVLLVATAVGLRLQPPEPPLASAAAGAGTGAGEPGEVELEAATELQWARTTHEPDTVWIWVTNHGTEPVRVRALELVTESFAPAGPVGKDDVVVPAGEARALTVSYGEGRCGGLADPPLAAASARLVLADSAGGSAGTVVELPLPHPDDQLARLLRLACAAQLVDESVTVRFDGWSPAPGDRLRGDLLVERRAGDAPVTVSEVAGSILFRLVAEQPEQPEQPAVPIGALAPGEARVTVPVVVNVNRCDKHAVAEAKLRYLFRVWIGVGDAEHLPVSVHVDQTGQEQLDQVLRRHCDL